MWHSLSSHVERENLWFTVLMKVWVRCDWIKGRDSYKSMWLPVSMPGGTDSCGSKSPSWLRRWMDGWVKSKFTLIYVWNAKAEKNEKANLFPSFQVIDGDRYALSGRPPEEVCSNFCLLIAEEWVLLSQQIRLKALALMEQTSQPPPLWSSLSIPCLSGSYRQFRHYWTPQIKNK